MITINKDEAIKTVEGEELIECLDFKDLDGNAIDDPRVVELIKEVYNTAVRNCVKAIEDLNTNDRFSQN